jgi:hypothetical protein
MNDIRKVLEQFLDNSTPEALRADLQKGYRPFLQTVEGPFLLASEVKFSFPATVSFFQGVFAVEGCSEEFDPRPPNIKVAANQELALAA